MQDEMVVALAMVVNEASLRIDDLQSQVLVLERALAASEAKNAARVTAMEARIVALERAVAVSEVKLLVLEGRVTEIERETHGTSEGGSKKRRRGEAGGSKGEGEDAVRLGGETLSEDVVTQDAA